jgi:hypothetical protein
VTAADVVIDRHIAAGVPSRDAGRCRLEADRHHPGSVRVTHAEVAVLRPPSARTANRTVDPGASPAIRAVVAGAVTAATRRAARPVHMSTEYLVAPPAPVHDTSTVVADIDLTVTAVGIATPAANVP